MEWNPILILPTYCCLNRFSNQTSCFFLFQMEQRDDNDENQDGRSFSKSKKEVLLSLTGTNATNYIYDYGIIGRVLCLRKEEFGRCYFFFRSWTSMDKVEYFYIVKGKKKSFHQYASMVNLRLYTTYCMVFRYWKAFKLC